MDLRKLQACQHDLERQTPIPTPPPTHICAKSIQNAHLTTFRFVFRHKRTDGRSDGRSYGRSDGPTDRRNEPLIELCVQHQNSILNLSIFLQMENRRSEETVECAVQYWIE